MGGPQLHDNSAECLFEFAKRVTMEQAGNGIVVSWNSGNCEASTFVSEGGLSGTLSPTPSPATTSTTQATTSTTATEATTTTSTTQQATTSTTETEATTTTTTTTTTVGTTTSSVCFFFFSIQMNMYYFESPFTHAK